MNRFVAFIWDGQNLGASSAAARLSHLLERDRSWTCEHSAGDMSVYVPTEEHRTGLAHALPDNSGVVLGTLFCKQRGNQGGIDADFVPDNARTMGQRLIKGYWGHYIAFLRGRDRRKTIVIRDCSGAIPCYRIRTGYVEVLFSDVGDLVTLNCQRFTINWRYIAAFLQCTNLQIRECGLKEVTEVLAGEFLEIGSEGIRQGPAWDPKAVCKADCIDDYQKAADSMRCSAQSCIDAWAPLHSDILLMLSGGFDSAVVLGCLSMSPDSPRTTCLNLFGSQAGDDEREYARFAANRAGCKLLERNHGLSEVTVDLEGPGLIRTAKPSSSEVFTSRDQLAAISRLAAEIGAKTIWSGQGGDHLFLKASGLPIVADYLLRHGLRPGLSAVISDSARLARLPYWYVVRDTLKQLQLNAPLLPNAAPERNSFSASDAYPNETPSYATHPWMFDAVDLPPGQQMQVHLLSDVLNRHRPIRGQAKIHKHYPFLCQPLIQTCLQTPTYLHLRGGRYRGLARYAFRDRVPTEILQRESKGNVTASIVHAIRKNRLLLRDLLLEGVLSREGIIAPNTLLPYLENRALFRPKALESMVACISVEIWARSWNC